MTRLRPLLLLLTLLGLGVISATPSGRAQQTSSSRFAFADTTLLRDTLGLHFDLLFPLADSLGLLPDTLRALAIRYRFPPERLVALADSMRVPVDSVGVVLERERFNPLASRREDVQRFSYNTTYNIRQRQSTWGNTSDYNLVRGPLFLRNNSSIQINRTQTGSRVAQQHIRNASTELGWKLSEDFSIGSRAILDLSFSDDPANPRGFRNERQQYELSVRARQHPTKSLRSELNLFSGLLNEQQTPNASADLNGQLVFTPSPAFSKDLRGGVSGRIARPRDPKTGEVSDDVDLSGNLSGTVSLLPSSPVSFNTSYSWRGSRIENPPESGRPPLAITGGGDVSGTLRVRADNERFLNLTPRFSTSRDNATRGGQNTDHTWGFDADGRYAWRGWTLESRFGHSEANNEGPGDTTGATRLGNDRVSRTLSGTLQRQVTARLNARLTGRIGLGSSRPYNIGEVRSSATPHDDYDQSYRIEANYNPSAKWNTGTALDVSQTHTVYLASADAARNAVTRTYRAEWRWSYQLLRGLTSSQTNQLGAVYSAYDFVPENDKLDLDFRTTTRLNAVLNPRLSLDITHVDQRQPRGEYKRAADGLNYFSPVNEGHTYEVQGTLSYTPTTAFALSLTPRYLASDNQGTLQGEAVPTSARRNLSVNGNINLNLTVGGNGRLTGTVGRTYLAQRDVNYRAGVPQPSPRGEVENWNVSLQFSWQP